jgi:hypothetical protein
MDTLASYEPKVIALQPRLRRVRASRRRALEAAGWRTWLTYHENHRRDADGRLVAIDERWLVELEHTDGTELAVEGPSAAAAWSAAWSAARTQAGGCPRRT